VKTNTPHAEIGSWEYGSIGAGPGFGTALGVGSGGSEAVAQADPIASRGREDGQGYCSHTGMTGLYHRVRIIHNDPHFQQDVAFIATRDAARAKSVYGGALGLTLCQRDPFAGVLTQWNPAAG